jgi:hypothetical protein
LDALTICGLPLGLLFRSHRQPQYIHLRLPLEDDLTFGGFGWTWIPISCIISSIFSRDRWSLFSSATIACSCASLEAFCSVSFSFFFYCKFVVHFFPRWEVFFLEKRGLPTIFLVWSDLMSSPSCVCLV